MEGPEIYIYIYIYIYLFRYVYLYIPHTMLALRGSYLYCTQLTLTPLFGFGRRLSRVSGYYIRMANAMKPMFFFVNAVGKRNKTNVVFVIRMANAITFFVPYPEGRRNNTNVSFAYPNGKRNKTIALLFIRIANEMQPMFFLLIWMAN